MPLWICDMTPLNSQLTAFVRYYESGCCQHHLCCHCRASWLSLDDVRHRLIPVGIINGSLKEEYHKKSIHHEWKQSWPGMITHFFAQSRALVLHCRELCNRELVCGWPLSVGLSVCHSFDGHNVNRAKGWVMPSLCAVWYDVERVSETDNERLLISKCIISI